MQERKDDSRRTYTVEETADILGIGLNQAYEAAARGDIPALRVGRRWLVPRQAFERMLDPPAPKFPTQK